MKKIAIIGLGWLGMPLALSLAALGYQVRGSKTTLDGVEAARMSGIECYPLLLTPELQCDPDDLAQLMQVDVLVITLPVSNTIAGGCSSYFDAVQQVVDSALAYGVPRIIFTSSTSVYGEQSGIVTERSLLQPESPAGKVLVELEQWLHQLPNTSVDVLRLAGLVGVDRHPGRFLAGKTGIRGGSQGVNLVHLDDVIGAIRLLVRQSQGGHTYNLCAARHPARRDFYPALANQLQLIPPQFCDESCHSSTQGSEGKSDVHSSGKLVDGSAICRELGFEYQYPDPDRMPVS